MNSIERVLSGVIENASRQLEFIKTQNKIIDNLQKEVKNLRRDNEDIHNILFEISDHLGLVEHD
jgi:hypothetical protein